MDAQVLTPVTLFVGIKNNVSGTTIEDPRLKTLSAHTNTPATIAKKQIPQIPQIPQISQISLNPSSSVKTSSQIQVIEFLGNGLVLEIPSRSCAMGHDLSVTIKTSGTSQDVEFSSTGKVIECTPLTEGRMQVCLSFLQLDSVSWKKLRDTLDQTQRRIDDLLSSMRGY